MSGIGNKVNDFLQSDRGEKASDSALDMAAKKANDATGGRRKDQIDKARQAADRKIGN